VTLTILLGWRERDLQKVAAVRPRSRIANYLADPVFRAALPMRAEQDMAAGPHATSGGGLNPRHVG